ncbi:hypothetical protein FS837_011011 [Tulasnella sp. UAMH 9824]|nr:hypothetical protein FS837_011011 [Tulasnella sp. UAMH 9824]
MSQSHRITPVDIHPDFNDPHDPWGSCRVGQVVPDCIAVFQPVGAEIRLTYECIEEEFGLCVIYDHKHKTFIVFLPNKGAARAVASEAEKLPGCDIFALAAEYEHFEENSGRIKDWVMQQAQDHLSHSNVSSLLCEVLENHESESSAAPNREEAPILHDDTSVLALDVFASQSAGLAEPEGLISSSEEDPNDPPNSEHDSPLSDEEAEELQGGSDPSLTSIQPLENPYQRHNRGVRNVLHTLVTTGPTEIRTRGDLHYLLSRPFRTDSCDSELEEALCETMTDARDIQDVTGDTTTLFETFSAIAIAWENLGLGPFTLGFEVNLEIFPATSSTMLTLHPLIPLNVTTLHHPFHPLFS